MKSIIYCRVSTKEQAKARHSLEMQEKACQAYAKRNGYDVLKVFIDKGKSGKMTARTGLEKLLEFISKDNRKMEIDAIIVYGLDRLSRDLRDHAELDKFLDRTGIGIKSVTENTDETPMGKFMKKLMTGLAELDHDMRSERARNAYWARR